jgi:hypothetical protein
MLKGQDGSRDRVVVGRWAREKEDWTGMQGGAFVSVPGRNGEVVIMYDVGDTCGQVGREIVASHKYRTCDSFSHEVAML